MLEGKIFSLKWIKPTTQGPQVADSVHFPLKEYCKRMKRRQILHEECNYIFFPNALFSFSTANSILFQNTLSTIPKHFELEGLFSVVVVLS